MTANQINYWKLQEEQRANRTKEAETAKHNRADEGIRSEANNIERLLGEARNAISAQEASTHAYQAQVGYLDYLSNASYREQQGAAALQNAASNARNARTNERNAEINQQNAYVNESNAVSNYMNAYTAQQRLLVDKYAQQINEYKAQTERAKAESDIALNKSRTKLTDYQSTFYPYTMVTGGMDSLSSLIGSIGKTATAFAG